MINFLRVSSLFRGRWWLWFYDCVMYVCSYFIIRHCMYVNIALSITLIVNENRWMMDVLNHNLIVWLWEWTLWLWLWLVEWIECCRHTNSLSLGSMRGPLTWHNYIIENCEMLRCFWMLVKLYIFCICMLLLCCDYLSTLHLVG